MTHGEYDSTVRDLFEQAGAPSSGFPPDERAGAFDNDVAGQVVTRVLAEGYMSAAEALAPSAALEVDALRPCEAGRDEETCAREAIAAVGLRVFRRPLDVEAAQDLFDAFTVGRAEAGYHGGLASMLEVALQSPEFLYRVELPQGPPQAVGGVRRSGWELASRMSYLFWGTMPDDALFAAAASGRLDSDDGVAAETARALADPRARVTVARFFEQWLDLGELDHLEKDLAIYPTFDPTLRTAFHAETLTFVDAVVWNGDGRLATLLTAPYSFINARLADAYGVVGVEGSALRRVELDPAKRAGLLTQGSFLALNAKFDQSSPVHRGKFVRERLLCTPLPPPPADVEIRPPSLDPRLTTRERFRQHAADARCAGCHGLMDPVGLGFEHFDGIGRFRETEGGQPVDARGELTGSDADGAFVGAVELAGRLASSTAVESCMAQQWFRFAYGRSDTPDDACTLEQLTDALHRSDGNLRALLSAVPTTSAFLERAPETAP